MPAAVIVPAAARIVLEHDLRGAVEFTRHKPRLRIGQAPAARQREIERAVFKRADERAQLDRLPRSHGAAHGRLERTPEVDRFLVRRAPFALEAFDLIVAMAVAAIEFAPGAEPAAVTERKIAGFSGLPTGFVIRRHRALQYVCGGDAVRF